MPIRSAAQLFVVLFLGAGLVACNHEVGGQGNGDGSVKTGPPVDAAMPVHDGGVTDAAMPAHDGSTSDGGTSCGPCNTPPSGGCYGLQGGCQNGACVYPIVSGATCDDGNPCTVADTCSANGQCTGTPEVCNTPPAQVCIGTGTLRTYDASGACQAGLCVYQSHDTSCGASMCTNNNCAADPCANLTCNMAPSVCYASAGSCANGSCSYAYADGATCDDGNACTTGDRCDTGVCQGVPMSCNAPPASVCANATTAQIYAPQGSCSVGSCSYTYAFQSCANGCANGECNASGWKAMASSTANELLSVWGSSASAVWAGGTNATLLFYDGVQWEARPSGITSGAAIQSIHGTSASNVFALTTDGEVLRFDGTSWSNIATITPAPFWGMSALFAIGNNDVMVYGPNAEPTLGSYNVVLDRITNGTLTQLYTGIHTVDIYEAGTTLWGFSASDLYVPGYHWNGTAFTATTSFMDKTWAASSMAIFGASAGGAFELNGTTWSALNAGNPGQLNGLAGSAANRVFICGGEEESTLNGWVAMYDGVGWTEGVLPAMTPSFNAVWASSTGQAFVVGWNGAIFEGP